MKRTITTLLLLYVTVFCAMAQKIEFTTALFRIGDDAAWSGTAIDESGWKEVSIKGSDQANSLETENTVAWYRIHFRVDSRIDRSKVVLIRFGYTDDADEAFLNGKRIGGSTAYDRASVYSTSARDLRLHGDNVLAIRVANRGGKGGVTEGRAKWHHNAKCLEVVDDAGEYIVAMSQESQYSKVIIDEVANYRRYAEADKALGEPAEGEHRVILMGDSITDRWASMRPGFFKDNGFTGRGISGETSAQFLLRFQNDVMDLNPAVVVINYGTNDIAENTGKYSEEQTLRNVKAMCSMAKGGGVKVILASTLPHGGFLWNTTIKDAMAKVRSLNAKVKAYAEAEGFTYVDYFSSMVSEDGSRMREDLSSDGVHPNDKGYEIMEALIVPACREALK